MSRNSAIASNSPAKGTTRDCDLALDSATGIREAGVLCNAIRNLRTGILESNNGIGCVSAGVSFFAASGAVLPSIPAGILQGACIQYGFQINTLLPAVFPSAGAIRRGVTRVISTIGASNFVNPAHDVGMQVMVGQGTLVDLLSQDFPVVNNGFGIWMLNGDGWYWGVKTAGDAAGTLADAIKLPITNPNFFIQVELRIFDSDGGVGNARVEVYVAESLFLTRYWNNPAGIVTPIIPQWDGSYYPQIRNCLEGPALVFFGDFCLIHGPNDSGTI